MAEFRAGCGTTWHLARSRIGEARFAELSLAASRAPYSLRKLYLFKKVRGLVSQMAFTCCSVNPASFNFSVAEPA